MTIDESTAYALAAWARFDDEISDKLLRAVCAAFAIVSSADGDVSEAEIDRFVEVIHSRSDAFPGVDDAALERTFRDIGQALLDDVSEGRRHALADIARVKDDERQRELVIGAARIAIAADERIDESEEAAMREICGALGVDPAGAR